ncbi:MAG: DUF1566 domain-containing protein [Thermodesulfobacteriota bacterium]
MKKYYLTLLGLAGSLALISCGGSSSDSGGSVPDNPSGGSAQRIVVPADSAPMPADQRFSPSGDTVTDELTGLTWLDVSSQGTWQDALNAVAALNTQNAGGHNDWRLPNRRELFSLVDAGEATGPVLTNGHPFTNILAGEYWTSTTSFNVQENPAPTPNSPAGTSAWVVDMDNGAVTTYVKYNTARVLYVRGASTVTDTYGVPQTGQTTCYDETGATGAALGSCAGTGQDGDIKAGVEWPTSRFYANRVQSSGGADGTVTDTLTGLMWMTEANCVQNKENLNDFAALGITNIDGGRVSWGDTVIFRDEFNDNNINCDVVPDYRDWRLPTIRELESLHSAGTSGPSLSNSDIFEHLVTDQYWSSTSSAVDPAAAWSVGFRHGYVENDAAQTSGHLVWLVRDVN